MEEEEWHKKPYSEFHQTREGQKFLLKNITDRRLPILGLLFYCFNLFYLFAEQLKQHYSHSTQLQWLCPYVC